MLSKQPPRRPVGRSGDFNLDGSPGHLLHRAQQRAADLTAQALRAHNLTPRQFAVLLALRQNEGVTQSDLVRRTGIDRSTLADMLSRLARRRLIVSKRTEQDQRANSVRITPEGAAALDAVTPRVAEAERRMLDALPPELRDNFVSCLQLLAGGMARR